MGCSSGDDEDEALRHPTSLPCQVLGSEALGAVGLSTAPLLSAMTAPCSLSRKQSGNFSSQLGLL